MISFRVHTYLRVVRVLSVVLLHDKVTGKQRAKRLTGELATLYNKGFVLIGVAGMKYAVIVEAMENKDVISSAADHAEDWIRKQSKTLFDKLAEKGY